MWVGTVAPLPLPPSRSFLAKLSAFKCKTASTAAYSQGASPSPSIHSSGYSSSSSSNGGSFDPIPSFLPGGPGSGCLPVAFAASRGRRGRSAPGLVEMDGGGEDFEGWEDEDGEDDWDVPAMPFDEMGRWLRSKPAGFGEGKSYDTTIEDKLLEEMEQSRQAQLANVNKLKSGSAGQARPKKQQPRALDVNVAEVAPNGACVRVRGLPRKKNIQKDLKLAFERFPGIVNISPAVVGNKKTRDPVCKGFAFIDFDSDEVANKFVQTYSQQRVLFGRVQKEITCDIIGTSCPSNPGSEKFSRHPMFTQKRLTNFQEGASMEPNLNFSTLDFEEKDPEVSNEIAVDFGTEEHYKKVMKTEDQPSSPVVDTSMDIGYTRESARIGEESLGLRNGGKTAESRSSKQKQKAQMVSSKKPVKTKPDKAPKLSMPGSVARLKVKERAVLTGVMSKYGELAVSDFAKKS